jgi:hypothetical protein
MTTLPQFIEAGMSFFRAKAAEPITPAPTSPATELAATPEEMQAEIDLLKSQVETLTAENAVLKAENEKLKGESVDKEAALASLEKNFVSAGRQTAQALASVAVAPVAVSATPTNAVKGFVELVHDRIASGKTKAESIGFCIKNHPAEYLLARQNGGLGKI